MKRPTGVTIIAVLFFIGGALSVLSGLLTLAVPVPADPVFSLVASYQIVISIAAIAVGALDLAIGWGLWTLQNWARIVAIIVLALNAIGNLFTGVGLLVGVSIEGYVFSMPGPGIASLLMAGVGAWLIWYLLKPDVALAFTGGAVYTAVDVAVAGTMPATSPPPPVPPPTVRQATPPPPPPSVRPQRQPTVPVGAPLAPEGWLVLRGGPRSGQQFGLKRGRNTVGRDPSRADIIIDEETVSGEHARIQFEQGRFYLYDLASTNGTFVNNRRIQKQLLMDNDVVRFGHAETVFKHIE